MLRFGYVVMVGSLFACLLFACGDKGAKPFNSAGGAAGTGMTGGSSGAGGGTGGVDGSAVEAGAATGGAGGTTTATVSYKNTIAPIVAASCAVSGCHNSTDMTMGYAFDTYAGLTADLDVANAAIQSGTMPISPGADLTAADKKNFQDWVNAGAPNN